MGFGLFFPSRCLICGCLGVYVCARCEKLLYIISHQKCIYCDKESPLGFTHPKCKKRFGVDGCMSLFYYNTPFKKILKNIKYKLVLDAKTDLFYLFLKYGQEQLLFYKKINDLFVTEIPLSDKKEKNRGFNQSALIANWAAFILNKQKISLLRKKRGSIPQARLLHHSLQRNKNIKDTFLIINVSYPVKNVLLVDDVITTGATVKEAAGVIKRAHKDSLVYALTLAKATQH